MINVAILGAGYIAIKMARTLQGMIDQGNGDVAMHSVAARDGERALQFAKEYGFEKAYGSYEEMLRDPDVDLVYVATPHSHHYEHMKMCLKHGKHILCEKAFTVNARQAREITELAQSKGLYVAEAIWTRYLPLPPYDRRADRGRRHRDAADGDRQTSPTCWPTKSVCAGPSSRAARCWIWACTRSTSPRWCLAGTSWISNPPCR